MYIYIYMYRERERVTDIISYHVWEDHLSRNGFGMHLYAYMI